MTDLPTFHSVTMFKYIFLKQPHMWMSFTSPLKCICRWIKTVPEMAGSLTYILGMCPLWNFTVYIKIIHLSRSKHFKLSHVLTNCNGLLQTKKRVGCAPRCIFSLLSQAWNKFCPILFTEIWKKQKPKKPQTQPRMNNVNNKQKIGWKYGYFFFLLLYDNWQVL